jgi:LPS export ABC transporter protein LptC
MRAHLLFVLLLAGLLVYMLNTATDDGTSVPEDALRLDEDYDYFLTEVDSTHFSLDGAARYRLQATRVTHFPDPDFAIVEEPDVMIFQETALPWHITAQTARIDNDPKNDMDRVQLDHHVVLTHRDPGGETLNILTESLTLYPSSRRAMTEQPVQIISSRAEMTSLGMVADLQQNTVELLANVRGRYEPSEN